MRHGASSEAHRGSLPLYVRAPPRDDPRRRRCLPFVPGGGGEMPELALALARRAREPRAPRPYAEVCGSPPGATAARDLPARARLPAAHGADGRRALPIRRRRPRAHREPDHPAPPDRRRRALDLDVRGTPPAEPSARAELRADHEGARRRGAGVGESQHDAAPRRRPVKRVRTAGATRRTGHGEASLRDASTRAGWTALGADLGRRYAAVSGDRNPIHTARADGQAFGFPSAIAHGMWTKARALAALEPAARRVHRRRAVSRPIALPGTSRLHQRRGMGAPTRFPSVTLAARREHPPQEAVAAAGHDAHLRHEGTATA